MSSSEKDKVVRPRRKTPLRSKSTDGADTTAAAPKKPGERRRMPPRRAKSFDSSGDKILQKTNSKRIVRRPSDTQSKSMRGLFSTANSAKNVVAEAPNLVVKAHKLLSTKVKVRPGQMPASALSSRNITEEHAKQRNPLTKALSTNKIQSTSNSSRSNSRSNSKDSKEPKEEEPKTTRRGGRKPGRSLTPARANGRSLTPAKSRTPKNLKDDKDCVAIF